MGWARAQGTTGISGFAAPQGEGHGFDPAQGCEGMWLPTYLGSSLAAWYKADAGCYTDAACLFASASSQYLSKTSPTFAPTTKMTIRFSWKPTAVGVSQVIVGRRTAQFLVYQWSDGKITVFVGSDIDYIGGSTVLVAGSQYEIVVVYDGTLAAANRVAIYINGVAEPVSGGGTIPATLPASTAPLEVGTNNAAEFANGALARLGLSSLALSGAALTAAHTSTFWADMTAARQADWFSFYNLCEASGTRVDSTGLNNLTPTNGPTVAAGPGEGLAVNNSPVKRIEDQSGNARHLLQSTIASQPLWIASGQNGRPIVRYDGVDDRSRAVYTLAQPVDVFTSLAWTVQDYLLDGGSLHGMALVKTGGTALMYAGASGPAPALPSTAFHVLRLFFSGASSVLSIDGGSDTTGNAGTNTTGGVTVGSSAIGTNFSGIDFGELFIASAAVGAPSQPKAYLNQRWAAY